MAAEDSTDALGKVSGGTVGCAWLQDPCWLASRRPGGLGSKGQGSVVPGHQGYYGFPAGSLDFRASGQLIGLFFCPLIPTLPRGSPWISFRPYHEDAFVGRPGCSDRGQMRESSRDGKGRFDQIHSN